MQAQSRPAGVAYGECWCGCGEKTALAPQTMADKGYRKGEPKRYIAGHNRRRQGPAYVIDDKTGCWNWQFVLNDDGYGVTTINYKVVRAHRLMYERAKGPIPEGLEIDHLCRNRACVNPDHLEAVTAATNQHRRVDTKLTPESVIAIRERYDAGERQAIIARDYGISTSLVYLVGKRQRWASV